jgi:light-regulated signal transduction histidine kinase (bacteriophytochrome)
MQQMLQNLLAYSRLSQIDRPKMPVDVGKVIAEVLQSLDIASDVEVSVGAMPGAMPVVMAWEGRLEQVFQNLIVNALKYRKDNISARIWISAEQTPDEWTFAVRDNGIGFRMEYAERIFGISSGSMVTSTSAEPA